MNFDYFRLAYRSAKRRQLRSWLTMIGIFIGIAAVVALVSLSQGLKTAIGQQFLGLGSDKLIVQAAGGGFGPPGTGVPEPMTTAEKKVIEKVQGVDLVVGRLIRIVQLEFKDEQKYTYAVTIPDDPDERELVIEANNYKIEQGKFAEEGFEIFIGHQLAVDFFDKPVEIRDKIVVQGHLFKVVGILKKSGNPQQDNTLVMPEDTLREILSLGNEYDVIPLRVASGEDIDVVAARIEKDLRSFRNVEEGKENFNVETPGQIIAVLNSILAIIQGVLVGIAGISLVVGGVGIMNTMYTAVLERTKEIGIMKAVGATRGKIMKLFLIESGFLGLFGGLIGIALGAGIGKLVEFIAFKQFGSALIQTRFAPSLLIGMLLFGFVVGMASGLFPARQAASLQPVEALRS